MAAVTPIVYVPKLCYWDIVVVTYKYVCEGVCYMDIGVVTYKHVLVRMCYENFSEVTHNDVLLHSVTSSIIQGNRKGN